MVFARMKLLDDLGSAARIQCGTRDDFAEQFGGYAPGAGECREQAAWPQQLQGEQVDVLVAARGSLRACRGRGELWRIENDQIKATVLVTQLAQIIEYVGVDPFTAIRRHVVQADMLPRKAQGLGRRVH